MPLVHQPNDSLLTTIFLFPAQHRSISPRSSKAVSADLFAKVSRETLLPAQGLLEMVGKFI
jgi:hypothetical protein